MRVGIRNKINAMALFALFSSSLLAQAQEENPGKTRQPLVGGAPVDAQTRETYGLLTLTSPEGTCSASMLNDYWAITAAHCVFSRNPPYAQFSAGQISLTADWPIVKRPKTATTAEVVRKTATAEQIVPYGTAPTHLPHDIALVQTGLFDFRRPDARERPLYKARPMANLSVSAYGRGINIFAVDSTPPQPTVSDGEYRSTQFDIAHIDPNSNLVPTTYSFAGKSGAIIAGGDSGGPAYIQEWDNPLSPRRKLEWQLIGVHSHCSVDSCVKDKSCDPGAPDPWRWVTSVETCSDAAILPIRDNILERIQATPPDHTYVGRFDTTPIDTAFLYAIRPNGNLVWYRSDERAGKKSWLGPRVVGYGWTSLVDVIGAGGDRFYGRTASGALLWYEHKAFNSGEPDWNGAIQVGSGWHGFSSIFAGGNGVIYAITPEGELHWYRHYGFKTGGNQPSDWAAPKHIGTGWNAFKTVFSAGDGVIYAIKPDGQLLWYRHKGVDTGSAAWDQAVVVGTGWQEFTQIFAAGDGVIYAVRPDGTLMRYKHLTWNAPVATFSWENNGQAIGSGWQDFTKVFTFAPMALVGPR